MRHTRIFLRGFVACVVACCLTGCSSDKQLESLIGTKVDKDRAPLVRPLPLVPMTAPLVVEFELPPPRKGFPNSLVLGLRVSESDGLSSHQAASEVVRTPFDTSIKLERLDAAHPTPVPLRRLEGVPGQSLNVVAVTDAIVPGARWGGLESVALLEAGLAHINDDRRDLMLAWMKDGAPGPYRLTIRLINPPLELKPLRAELIIGYARKGK